MSHQSTGVIPIASQVPQPIEQALRKMGPVVDPLATATLYSALHDKPPHDGIRVSPDLRYGHDPRHLLDVFAPHPFDGAARPVLVFVHGGGFTHGDRRSGDGPFYDNVVLWAVHAGCIGVNMTYRLAPGHVWPAVQQDLATALRWIKTNIAAYGGDPRRIVLMGHSAGATHVAHYLGHPTFHVEVGGGVEGAALLSGLYYTDGTAPATAQALQAYLGQNAARYPVRSPVAGLQRSRVPLFLAFAELDPPDFRRQAVQLHTALRRAGIYSPPFEMLGHNHLSEIYAINTADTGLTQRLSAFLSNEVLPMAGRSGRLANRLTCCGD